MKNRSFPDQSRHMVSVNHLDLYGDLDSQKQEDQEYNIVLIILRPFAIKCVVFSTFFNDCLHGFSSDIMK